MGRIPEGKDGTYLTPSISYLWPHHRKMVRLAAAGLRPGEIAAVVGMTPPAISAILGSAMFQAELRRLEEKGEEIAIDLREDLRLMAETAIENLDEDLNLPPETLEARRVRQKASLETLDRFGLTKKERPSTHINVTQLNIGEMTTEQLRNSIFDITAEPVDEPA